MILGPLGNICTTIHTPRFVEVQEKVTEGHGSSIWWRLIKPLPNTCTAPASLTSSVSSWPHFLFNIPFRLPRHFTQQRTSSYFIDSRDTRGRDIFLKEGKWVARVQEFLIAWELLPMWCVQLQCQVTCGGRLRTSSRGWVVVEGRGEAD